MLRELFFAYEGIDALKCYPYLEFIHKSLLRLNPSPKKDSREFFLLLISFMVNLYTFIHVVHNPSEAYTHKAKLHLHS